ncbi:MAG: SH3 domain-containing protein [Anaerolineae bacterium]
MPSVRIVVLFVLTLFFTSTVLAQAPDCPAIIQQLIEAARENCSEIGLNQACYGSPEITIQPRPNVRLDFSKPGDTVALSAIESLSTSAFNPEAESWGLSVLNLRADLIEDHLTAVAFGQVELINNSQASADFLALEITVSNPTGANLRAGPSAESAVIRQLFSGDRVSAIGRLDDGSWVRIADGWVSADVIRSTSDLTQLQVLDPDSQIADVYAPMQSMNLHTKGEDSPCTGVPDSGLLVQTPSAVSSTLIVNGAGLSISGTLLAQTTTDGRTILSVLEGEVFYAEGRRLEPAQQIEYGFQGDKLEFAAPQEYDYANAVYLPLVLLPREFDLPFSLGGVIFPFTPGTGFLQTIPSEGQCTVAWSVDVNLRAGPGTNYPIRRGVASGFYGLPDARAVGSDGAIWWRLVEGVWTAADNTAAAGACGTLPLVAPPPLPTG